MNRTKKEDKMLLKNILNCLNNTFPKIDPINDSTILESSFINEVTTMTKLE